MKKADAWRRPFHVVVEVENKNCKMLKTFAAIGLRNLKVVDLRSSSKGSVKHLVELNFDQVKRIPSDMRSSGKSGNVFKGSRAIWFESEGCEVCNTILAYDAFLVAGRSVEQEKIMYSFMVPTFEAYSAIVAALECTGHKVNVIKMGQFEPRTGVLTENQERVFWLAFKGGFFDFPRKVGTRELSAKLGIRPSTLSETVRRGTRRLIEHYFKDEIK
jgi:predicted DNA binding protein